MKGCKGVWPQGWVQVALSSEFSSTVTSETGALECGIYKLCGLVIGHLWGNLCIWKVLHEEPRSQVTIRKKNKVLLGNSSKHVHQEPQHAKYPPLVETKASVFSFIPSLSPMLSQMDFKSLQFCWYSMSNNDLRNSLLTQLYLFTKGPLVHIKLSLSWMCALSAPAGTADLHVRTSWLRVAELDQRVLHSETLTLKLPGQGRLCAGVSWQNSSMLHV